MAKVNTAKITQINDVQKGSRILTFELIGEESLVYIGGQYVILNSGIKLSEEKFSKGSYTLLPGNGSQQSFCIAAKKVGVCSKFLVETAQVGDELQFSGPWGAKKVENFKPKKETLVLVTDTGISAAIAILNNSLVTACLNQVKIIWMQSATEDFIPLPIVIEMLPYEVRKSVEVHIIAAVGFSKRIEQAQKILKETLEKFKPKHALLAGDGDVISVLQQDLYSFGIDEDIPMDWFFNNPKTKVESPDPKNLKTGFTTGACSAAAAKAAVKYLLQSNLPLKRIETTLPNRDKVTFALKKCQLNDDGSATCSIIKDAGDDPDCTDKAELIATVFLKKDEGVDIFGGCGVATVTKEGLGLTVGQPAINPVPWKNIIAMVLEELENSAYSGAKVTISVPGGVRMAKETMNERLGLIGGISILGTTGIVRPYSTAAYRASIIQAINLAEFDGCTEVVVTTGGRSEEYAMKILDHLSTVAFIQVGDFIGASLKALSKTSIKQVTIVGMMGKLSKMADGKTQTHQAGSSVNMPLLARFAKELGATDAVVEEILKANTARHVLEICQKHKLEKICSYVCQKVVEALNSFIDKKLQVHCYLVDFGGKTLGQYLENH